MELVVKRKSVSESVSRLLEEREWMAGLARALVAQGALGGAEAEDAEQETWLAALGYREALASPRAFLATVFRNKAGAARRSAGRRRRREEALPPREPGEATSDRVERFETQRVVASAVAALDEPYRTTVLAHYYDGASLADIAREQGVAAGTVRWRLHKAKELLRRELEREYGEGEWRKALLPLCAFPAGAASSVSVGGVAMVAAALLLVSAAGYWFLRGESADVDASPLTVREAAPDVGSAGSAGSVASSDERVDAEAPRAPGDADKSESEEQVAEQHATLRARVVDARGDAIDGASLRLLGARLGSSDHVAEHPLVAALPPARSDASGALVLPLRAGVDLLASLGKERRAPGEAWDLVFEARAKGYLTRRVHARIASGDDVDIGRVALDAATTLSGRVVDENGRGLAGAKVHVTRAPFPVDCEAYVRDGRVPSSRHSAETASWLAKGSYKLAVASGEPLLVWAQKRGYRSAYLRVDARGPALRVPELVLTPAGASGAAASREVEVTVLDPRGRPLPRARIASVDGRGHMAFHFCDERGVAQIEVAADAPARTIYASDPEGRYSPAVLERATLEAPLQLRLEPLRTRTIQLRSSSGRELREPRASWTLLRGAGRASARVLSAEEGRARLSILVPELPARLRVQAAGHRSVEQELVAGALEDLALTLEPAPRLVGRVVHEGAPVAGARVRLLRSSGEDVLCNGFASRYVKTRVVVQTDAQGRFAIDAGDAAIAAVAVHKPGYAALLSPEARCAEVSGEHDLGTLELCAPASVHGVVLDARGQPAPRALVVLHSYVGDARTVSADRLGRYRFDELRAGSYELRPSETRIDAGATHSVEGVAGLVDLSKRHSNLRLERGESRRVDLRLGSCEARIRLRVDAAGERAFDARGWTASWRFAHELRVAGEARFGADGSCALRSFSEGPFVLTIRSPGGPDGSLTLTREIAMAQGGVDVDVSLSLASAELQVPERFRSARCRFVHESGGVTIRVEALSDADGRVRLPLAPRGALALITGLWKKPEIVARFVVR